MGAIDVGSTAEARVGNTDPGSTKVDKNNSANDSGTITSVEMYFHGALGDGANVEVALFDDSGNNLTTRSNETIGAVTAGSKQTFSGLDMNIETGDWIGIYWTSGNLYATSSGGGRWEDAGDQIPCTNNAFNLVANRTISLYGIGTTDLGETLKLEGTSVNALSTVGAIAIVLDLAGTSANVISTVGAINAIFVLQGTSANVFSTIGALTLGIVEKIAGTSVNAFTTLGNLGITLDFTGASANVFSTTGGLSVTFALKGTSVNAVSTTGALSIVLDLTGTSVNAISTISNRLNATLALQGTSANVFDTLAPELIVAKIQKLLGTSVNVFSTTGAYLGLQRHLLGTSVNAISAISDALWINVSYWTKTGKGSSSMTEMGKGSSSMTEMGKGSATWTEEIKTHT